MLALAFNLAIFCFILTPSLNLKFAGPRKSRLISISLSCWEYEHRIIQLLWVWTHTNLLIGKDIVHFGPRLRDFAFGLHPKDPISTKILFTFIYPWFSTSIQCRTIVRSPNNPLVRKASLQTIIHLPTLYATWILHFTVLWTCLTWSTYIVNSLRASEQQSKWRLKWFRQWRIINSFGLQGHSSVKLKWGGTTRMFGGILFVFADSKSIRSYNINFYDISYISFAATAFFLSSQSSRRAISIVVP